MWEKYVEPLLPRFRPEPISFTVNEIMGQLDLGRED